MLAQMSLVNSEKIVLAGWSTNVTNVPVDIDVGESCKKKSWIEFVV